MATAEDFKLCSLVPVVNISEASAWNVTSAADGSSWKTSSFFLDTSGRSSVYLPLQLSCPSREFLERLVQSRAFDAYNVNSTSHKISSDGAGGSSENEADPTNARPEAKFSVDAKVTLTFGTGEALSAFVEDVIVSSVTIQEESVFLDACVMVRVSRADGEKFSIGPTSRVKTNLEVSGLLVQELESPNDRSLSSIGLDARSLGSSFPAPRAMVFQQTRLAPVPLLVVLSHAMSVSVNCVQGPTLGQTFVSVTVRHSNTHTEPVTINSIAIHPGHSVERPSSPSNASSSSSTTTDMSKAVLWRYAPKCDPQLPAVLRQCEALSTILLVDAEDERRSRTFASPLSVTAVVGEDAESGAADDAAFTPKTMSVVAASEITYSTYRSPMEPSDAFRIDMRIVCADPNIGSGGGNAEEAIDSSQPPYTAVPVGSTFEVQLDISNLSKETRDVVVLVDGTVAAADARRRPSALGSKPLESAVVSEKDGHTFSVLGMGLDGSDAPKSDPAANADDGRGDLLLIDSAVHVGEMKGGARGTATIRMVPTRDGTLRVPHLQLLDRRRGKRYDAPHTLRVVVVQSGA